MPAITHTGNIISSKVVQSRHRRNSQRHRHNRRPLHQHTLSPLVLAPDQQHRRRQRHHLQQRHQRRIRHTRLVPRMRIPLRLRQQQHMQHIRDSRVAHRIRLLPLTTHHPGQNLLQPCAIRCHSKHGDRNPHAHRTCNQSRYQRAPLPSPQKPHQQQNWKHLHRRRNSYQHTRRNLPSLATSTSTQPQS